MGRPRVTSLLVLAGVLAVVATFAPALAGRTIVGADLGTFSLPQHALLAGLLRDGRLPGWNPLVGHGGPLLADASFAPLYPANVLLLVLDPLTALNLAFVLHLGAALAGTLLLARAIGVSPAGALLAAASFALGGTVVSYVDVPIYVSAIAWVPWQALLVRRALEPAATPARALLAGLPFALAFLTAGAELCVMGFALGLALSPPGARPGASALRAALTVLAAVGLAAPALVPLLLVVGDTDRALGLGFAEATRWSLRPSELVGLLMPVGQLERGAGRPWHASLYLGAVPLAFAGLALVHLRDGLVRRLAIVAGLLLLYALGEFAFLQPFLWEHAPGFGSLRYPAKAFLPVALALALLAGLGLDRARRSPRAGALALSCVGLAALALRAVHPLAAITVALSVGAVAPRGRRAALVVLLTLLDLGVAARATVSFAPRSLYDEPATLLAPALAAAAPGPDGPLRLATLPGAWTVRAVPTATLDVRAVAQRVSIESLFPNTTMPHGLRSTVGFSSFASRRVRALLAAARARDVRLARQVLLLDADLAVFTADDLPSLPPGTEELARAEPWRLGLLPTSTPWAALHGQALAASSEAAALDRVLDPAFDPTQACVVEGPPLDGPRGLAGNVRPVDLDFDRLELEVHAQRPAMLVVREAWGRGWTARVDDAPAPLYPADVLYRAVPVPAGRHHVVLEYAAPGRTAGLIVGLVALAALGVGIVRRRV